MRWGKSVPDKNTAPERAASHDAEVARLTARADLVIEELDAVVTELSTMLKSAYGIKDD